MEGDRLQWCGDPQPHGEHEWIDRVTRRQCPGIVQGTTEIHEVGTIVPSDVDAEIERLHAEKP